MSSFRWSVAKFICPSLTKQHSTIHVRRKRNRKYISASCYVLLPVIGGCVLCDTGLACCTGIGQQVKAYRLLIEHLVKGFLGYLGTYGTIFGSYVYSCSRNNQYYALIFTTPLFYILAPTCFGSSLRSSGSLLDPSELLEIQIEWVVYHIMCGYVACVPECHSDGSKKLPDDGRLLQKHVGASI
jgi:hypothetical protein